MLMETVTSGTRLRVGLVLVALMSLSRTSRRAHGGRKAQPRGSLDSQADSEADLEPEVRFRRPSAPSWMPFERSALK
eukprot:1281280-Rhodomonas_salina.3